MPRPKRPFNGQEHITPIEPAWMGASLGVRQRTRFDQSQHMTHRVANGCYDPLSIMLVLDVLANIDPDIELRARALTEFLNQARPQFLWDSVTVGKVLSDIHDQFEDVLGAKNGILERGKDYRGHFYLIHRSVGAAKLFVTVHEALLVAANTEIATRANRRPVERTISPLSEIPALRPAWVDV